ncbi:hypothetical protein BCR41DRAFT_26687 [Lobosporangium transversale]|uniref:Uncharacterized protein n=1 Tax=Lobosporangium transversale TaxID=64571 RepID=A0A1Y2GRS4_9FUNG|nr:hypothetical protein BCR41DRAFT_26687 [Lobosporangium transversale]ORZ20847.1 hypothetical protein BCR41DRAFT_26687 [Lobosporangium transversale]|eukprot:XP_021882756.1 hypothetical protein BCR41DRAFT_26687 [Lobosporangium transversale]
MDDLGRSNYEHIRRRAKSAGIMTKYDIDKYYKTIEAKTWRDEIDANREGAGYFLLQRGRLNFNPTDYIAFRRLERSESYKLPIEWSQWILDLKESSDEHVRRKADAAPIMGRDDIHGYYKNIIVDEHELEILGLSSKQTIGGSHHLASLLEDRQGKPNTTQSPTRLPSVPMSPSESTQDQNLRNDDQHLDMPRQKKARICLSPFPLHGASSVSSRHTPPYAGGSADSSPELSTISPPSSPDFTLDGVNVEQEANSFFSNVGTLQDILFNSLQEGKNIPSWAKNRPLNTFILRLKEDWGVRVTSLYYKPEAHTDVLPLPFLVSPLSITKGLLSGRLIID